MPVEFDEELCRRTLGKIGMSKRSNKGWWTKELAKAIFKQKETWMEIKKEDH